VSAQRFLLCLPKLLRSAREVGEPALLSTRELVERPGGNRRLSERGDSVGLSSLAVFAESLRELVPSRRKLAERKTVETIELALEGASASSAFRWRAPWHGRSSR
jgi:hypothetical protein